MGVFTFSNIMAAIQTNGLGESFLLPMILNMSITGSLAILFVLLVRLALKCAPKIFSYALWSVVLFRLLCPVSITTDFSLLGLLGTPAMENTKHTTAMEYVPFDVVHTRDLEVHLPVAPIINEAVNNVLPQEHAALGADPLEGEMATASFVWLLGVAAMAVYSVVSYLRLRRRLLTVSPLRENIYLVDEITSPFVMGLVRPKIYLPSDMEEREQAYIIRHEQHHIRRGDHIIKALAFLALSIHWFNPLVWVAFIYSSKDMEMSCDEAVVKKMGNGILADYTASLLSLATGKQIIAGMPLAFGEGDTKSRIRNLANWRKPAFWVVLLAMVACVALAVGLMTNPAKDDSWIKATHGATSVELECNLTPPIRSYAIYEDIYENGELISSEAIIFDRFQEDGGATPRRATLSLNAQPVNGEEGGFSGKLSLYFEGVGSAHLTRKLPKNHYTGAVHVAAEIGNGIFSKQKVATEDNVTLLTILLSTDPEGRVVVKTQNNTLVQSNDTVVIYRLVTSEGGEPFNPNIGGGEATHLFYGNTDITDSNSNETLSRVQEVKLIPGNYDFDHDGVPETVEVLTYQGWFELQVKRADGTTLWSDVAGEAHTGYNSLFACTLDGVDYLLRYHPTMYQGDSSYVYQLFSFDTQGNIIINREAEVYFDINWGSSMHREFNAAEIADFMDEVNDLLAHSKLLLSTDEALELINPDHPQDIPWWLLDGTYCSGYVYDESKSLRDNLLALQRVVENTSTEAKDNMTNANSFLPNTQKVQVVYYSAPDVHEWELTQEEIGQWRNWLNNLTLEQVSFESGEAPETPRTSGSGYIFHVNSGEVQVQYIDKGADGVYLFLNDVWYKVNNPTEPFNRY